jgi:hypothetical protein
MSPKFIGDVGGARCPYVKYRYIILFNDQIHAVGALPAGSLFCAGWLVSRADLDVVARREYHGTSGNVNTTVCLLEPFISMAYLSRLLVKFIGNVFLML